VYEGPETPSVSPNSQLQAETKPCITALHSVKLTTCAIPPIVQS